MVNTSKFLGKPKTLNGKKRLEYQPYDVNSRKNRVKPSGDDEKVDVVVSFLIFFVFCFREKKLKDFRKISRNYINIELFGQVFNLKS